MPVSEKPLLILDLDETLIYGSEVALDILTPHCRVGQFYIYCRPYLEEFISSAADHYDLAVWSSASPDYVQQVVRSVFPGPDALRFVWASDRCTRRYDPEWQEYHSVKNLKKACKLGYAIERILIIDDTPKKLSLNYGNLIRVRPFEGAQKDTELSDLLPYLRWISTADNFRRLEKRQWMNFGKSNLD